ncbi:hypothetical protein KKF91_02310, partial [Myxococcota bacterium]|nr:hypothetical protein [Myxococcota bacterium]
GSVDCALQLLAFLEARTILEPKAGDFSGSDDFFAKSMTLSTPRAQNVSTLTSRRSAPRAVA